MMRWIPGLLALLSLTACVTMPAPTYQPSVDNSQTLLASSGTTMQVETFTAAHDVENNALSVRGSKLEPGFDGTYATYLREALVTELKTAGRLDDTSWIRIGGVLTENELDGSGASKGTASVAAKFVVFRDDVVAYEKTLRAEHEWDSSFVGAIAIPAAFDNYGTTVQKLLQKLLADPDFVEATRPRT